MFKANEIVYADSLELSGTNGCFINSSFQMLEEIQMQNWFGPMSFVDNTAGAHKIFHTVKSIGGGPNEIRNDYEIVKLKPNQNGDQGKKYYMTKSDYNIYKLLSDTNTVSKVYYHTKKIDGFPFEVLYQFNNSAHSSHEN